MKISHEQRRERLLMVNSTVVSPSMKLVECIKILLFVT